MDRAQLFEHVVDAMRKVQTASGRSAPDVGGGTRPVGDLESFDSLCGVEATVILGELLGVELTEDSVFMSQDGSRALTVDEIVEKLMETMEAEVRPQ